MLPRPAIIRPGEQAKAWRGAKPLHVRVAESRSWLGSKEVPAVLARCLPIVPIGPLMAVLAALPGGAAVYYVAADDPAAADGNPGSAAKPWKTAQRAADMVQPGDTVRLKAGLYRQQFVIKAGGQENVLPIRAGTEIADWWSPVLWQEAQMLGSHGTFVAWQGSNGSVGRVTVFATRWINPRPAEIIESVTFQTTPEQAAVPLLLAITGVEGEGDGAATLREAATAARLPAPEQVRFYVSFDGAASALTTGGELEAEEARQASVNIGQFLPGARGRALHIATRLTYDNLPQFLDPRQGTLSVWVRPDDWFTEEQMKTYAGAGYRRKKCIMQGAPIRDHIAVPQDPNTGLWAADRPDPTEMDALGGPADRKARLGIIWNNVNRPGADITAPAAEPAWQPARRPDAPTWHHVAVTWEGLPKGKIVLYLDGAKAAEQVVGAALLPPDPILFLGNARNGGYLLDGADEFVLWGTPLDEASIGAYYRQLRADRPDPTQ